ncbi:Bactericidal permeability-increasing protein [Oryzias melastigma]|uniref:Bactericidal permeability-increasing protein n=1 Tax=Oryzias melastigma TaxID=30732 RepID=A0A834FJR3_ORYME|nr:Bactericidal permeability-increasing protein [Oryzias melastigma]
MLQLVIVALMLLPYTCGQNPAIQVLLTNKGLQYGKHVGAGWIQDMLEHVTLPDIQGNFNTLIGTIQYTLSGLKITKCDFPEPNVEFSETFSGFKTTITGLNAALSGGWAIKYYTIHGGGSFDMAILGVDVTSVVSLGRNADGHLSVNSVSCDGEVQDVNIQLYGGSRYSYCIFFFQICPAVQKSVEELESRLQAMNVSYAVNQVLSLELPLTRLPVFSPSNLNLGLKGEFYSIQTHAEPPFQSKPFTMPDLPGYMLSAGVSEFSLNSAAYGYFSAKKLQILITDSMIPKLFPFHLNTSSMGPYVPQLPKLLPGLLMNLNVYATEAPMFSVQSGFVNLTVQAAVKASAIESNGSNVPLFTLKAVVMLGGKMWIADGRMKGSVMLNNFTLTLASTEVGPFKTDNLEKMCKNGIELFGLPQVNKKLAEGMMLPRMKHVTPVNSVLTVEEGFITISSDAQVLDVL